jgi:predicted DNA-binding transcriptional regulator AlpA
MKKTRFNPFAYINIDSNDLNELTFLTINDLCNVFKRDRTTIYRWRKSGKLPEPTTIGNSIIGWKKEVIINLIDIS